MTDVTPNIPEVVTEVRALFERYEQALIDKNVDVLDATFWDSPFTVRYSFKEHGILTLGRDVATVNLQFKVRGRERIGRQSQTWVRFPDLGWKVIAAHVSTMEPS